MGGKGGSGSDQRQHCATQETPDLLALRVGGAHQRWPHVGGKARQASAQGSFHERDLGQRRGVTGVIPLVEVRLQLVSVLEIAALDRVGDAERKFDDRAPAAGHQAIDTDFRQARPSTVITEEDLQLWLRSLEGPRDAEILSRVLHAG